MTDAPLVISRAELDATISAALGLFWQKIRPRLNRPSQVTQKQAAEMLGVHQQTVRNYVKGGVIRLNAAGMIPISEIDRLSLGE